VTNTALQPGITDVALAFLWSDAPTRHAVASSGDSFQSMSAVLYGTTKRDVCRIPGPEAADFWWIVVDAGSGVVESYG
jgi:hypothetical protein